MQGQSRAHIYYRGMTCNELPCSVAGSLKKGRRAKHLNCEINCPWNPVGHVQKARGWRRVLWSHMVLLQIVGDCRQNLKLLSFCERVLSCFVHLEYQNLFLKTFYTFDSVDCGSFCGFFCVSFSLHTELWSERGLCGRSWTSWVDQLLLGCKMLHGWTLWNIEEELLATGHCRDPIPWFMIHAKVLQSLAGWNFWKVSL